MRRTLFVLTKRIAAVGLVALLTACAAATSLAETFQVTGKVREDMPSFRYTLEYTQHVTSAQQQEFTQEGNNYYISAINVAVESDNTLVQRIELNPPAETYDNETFGFELGDMNFDGYADLRIMKFVSIGVSTPYYCYLWSPTVGTYVYDEALSAIPSPMFNADALTVQGFESPTDTEYIDTTYAYNPAGVLTLIGRVTTHYDYEAGSVLTTIEQLVDGQMQQVEQRREKIAGLEEMMP